MSEQPTTDLLTCTCYDRAPTVPVFRSVTGHLPDCPQYGSRWLVGSEFKWFANGKPHVDSKNCPCGPSTAYTSGTNRKEVLVHHE